MTSTETVAEAISRFRPRRLTRTSPARPEADSRLVKATAETVSANSMSSQRGEVPMSIVAVSASMSTTRKAPSTITSSCSTTSASTSTEMRSIARLAFAPRMLRTAT